MAENVETAIYRLQVEGMEQIRELKSHVDGLAIAEENATASTRKFSQGLQTSIARGDETVRALENIRKALVSYEGYAEEGKGTQQQLAAYYDITNQKVAAQTAKLEELAVATENARRAQASLVAGPGGAVGGAAGAATYAAEFERMMTISEGKAAQIAQNFGRELDERMIAGTTKAAADSGRAMATELDKLDKIAQLKAQQAGQNFQRSLNEHFGIDKSQAYVRGAAGRAGSAFGDVEPEGITRANKSMEQLGNLTKVARYEMINLGRQAQDVVVSLGSGQNILMVGLQQGSQILDVFLSSERSAADIFKGMGTSIKDFLVNPITLAVGAIGATTAAVLALALAWDKAAVAQQRAISGAGTRTGTTASDINAFVAKNTPSAFSSSTLTTTESRALAESMTQTGNIVISQLHNMSDAVLGFSNQSQKSVSEAIKVFEQLGKDPKKAMDQIEETMGAFSQKTRDIVDDAVKQGDATRAANAVIDEMNIKLKGAAANMDAATQAGRGLRNVFGTLFSASAGTPLEKQLEDVRQKLSEVIEEAARMPPEFISPAMKQNIIDLSKQFEELYKRQQEVLNSRNTAVFDDITKKAREATEALIPEVKQIEALEVKIRELKAAEDAGGGSPRISAARAKAESDLQTLNESEAASKRIVEETNRIAAAHQGVSRAVALTLDGLEKQTALAGAVGGAEKMAAQYAIDYADAKKQGATATEAALIASEKQAATQAALNASARETLFSLQNMAGAAAAVTGEQKIQAQQQATINKLLHDGVSAELAMAVAAQEAANAHAAATAAVKNQVHSLEQSTELMIAQQNGTEATTKAAQAYDNAIRSGADALSASAVYGATLTNELTRAAIEADKMAQSMAEAELKAAMIAAKGNIWAPQNLDRFGGVQGQPTGSSIPLVQTPSGYYAANDASSFALAYDQQQNPGKYDPRTGLLKGPTDAEMFDAAMAPFELSRARAEASHDVSGQIAALQGELGLAQGLPETADKYQKITQLQTSIDQLTNSANNLTGSTDNLNATNRELLSPYYTQDPRTSHIGFRSQGMASGGYVDVPGGVSTNDNMIATIPVASGERIYIDPMNNRRSTGSGSGMVINISSPITINGNANVDQFGRTVYQNNQQLAKQVRAATQ